MTTTHTCMYTYADTHIYACVYAPMYAHVFALKTAASLVHRALLPLSYHICKWANLWGPPTRVEARAYAMLAIEGCFCNRRFRSYHRAHQYYPQQYRPREASENPEVSLISQFGQGGLRLAQAFPELLTGIWRARGIRILPEPQQYAQHWPKIIENIPKGHSFTQDHGPKLLKISHKAIILHTIGVQVLLTLPQLLHAGELFLVRASMLWFLALLGFPHACGKLPYPKP